MNYSTFRSHLPNIRVLLLIEQRNHCYSCGRPLQSRYVIDHNHDTGEVRGLACYSCNSKLSRVLA